MSKNSCCFNCKYWSKRDNKNQGKCDNEKFVYGIEALEDGLSYWDYEGYLAGFYTGPKFSCVHWVNRDE